MADTGAGSRASGDTARSGAGPGRPASRKRRRRPAGNGGDGEPPAPAENAQPSDKRARKGAKKSKKQPHGQPRADSGRDGGGSGGEAAEHRYPYEVEDADHCETPLGAYRDISPLLATIASELGKKRRDLRIYDPYFCEGAVKARLAELGFHNVYNEKEDFYKVQEKGLPDFDVLVTNPPYSGDNVERLLTFCASMSKPFFLLMPNWVYAKPYYQPSLRAGGKPVRPTYVVPASRYQYTTPKGRRQAKTAKWTAPFPSFWYIGLRRHGKIALQRWRREVHGRPAAFALPAPAAGEGAQAVAGTGGDHAPPTLVTRTEALPPEVVADGDPRKKKLRNALKRKKNKRKKKAGAQAAHASAT